MLNFIVVAGIIAMKGVDIMPNNENERNQEKIKPSISLEEVKEELMQDIEFLKEYKEIRNIESELEVLRMLADDEDDEEND